MAKKQMSGRERMLAALNRSEPDRLPASIHGWMAYYLNTYLNGMDDFEAFDYFGLDASIYCLNVKETHSHTWRVTEVNTTVDGDITRRSYEIETPDGKLTYTTESNQYTTWTTEHLVKNPEDIYLIKKYRPVFPHDHEFTREKAKRLGDRGIIRSGRTGAWHEACDLHGTQNMIMAYYDNRPWVEEFLDILNARTLMFIETVKGAPVDLFETGGGHGSSTVISPTIFRELLLPREKIIHQAVHDIGIKAVYHTCGGMMPLLDLLVETGTDAVETLTPKEMGGDVELDKVKDRIGDKVCLIGGFDQLHGFVGCTPKETKEMVYDRFRKAGCGGGYIMNPSDHFFEAPVENVKAYAEAAGECVYD